MRFHTSNPIYRGVMDRTEVTDRPITYAGVALRTLFLLFIAGGSGIFIVTRIETVSIGLIIGLAVVAFISAIVGTRSPRLAQVFSIIYALCEGAILGLVSVLYASFYEGIVPSAIATTLIVLVVMMILYSMNLIKVNQKFASFLVVSMISIIIMSLIGILFPVFGGGSFYTLICVLSTLVACLYLFWDFENIKYCVESGADASAGWMLSLGLMVSLVWIYVEVLRLLAIFGNRRN